MKDKYLSLVEQLENKFSSNLIPNKLLANVDDNDEDKLSENQICILRDFKNMPREKISFHDATNMILDGSLVSDESICYYLPRLAKQILIEGGVQGEFLKWRLEEINLNLLKPDQKKLIGILSDYLNEIEYELDNEKLE